MTMDNHCHNHHHHHHFYLHHNHEYNTSHHQTTRGHHNWRKSRSQSTSKMALPLNGSPFSLLDLSAKVVAQHIPFQSIEQRYEHIPEPVQRRVIFWSFPRHEDDIKLYSSLSSDALNSSGASNTVPKTNIAYPIQPLPNPTLGWIDPRANTSASANTAPTNSGKTNSQKQLTFHKGLRLYDEGCVRNVLQVGFNLSGQVNVRVSQPIAPPTNSRSRGNPNLINNQVTNQDNDAMPVQQPAIQQQNDAITPSNETYTMKSYRVSVTFDRCKITSVSCSCNLQDIFWCEHVVALILLRIRNPETVDLRVPISETLLSLDRQQLQKLVQYLIAEHHTEVLPTAQRLLDQMSHSLSDINQIHGAPDPTAGASADDDHIWHLDERQVNEKVQNYLNSVFSSNSTSKDAHKQINALFEKVREMFRAKDSNGTRLLKLMTEQFLQHATRNEKSRPLWDQLVFLWVVVMLNPDISKSSRQTFVRVVSMWSQASKCPKEDIERRASYKRKAADFSDDEESEADLSSAHYNQYMLNFGQSSNNYPAHMANLGRSFPASTGFPPLRPFNQLPLPSCPSCPCQVPSTKKLRTAPQNNEPSSSGSRSRPLVQMNNRSNRPFNENRPTANQEPRSIFHVVLDFQDASWDDPHLQLILNKDGPINVDPNKASMVDFVGNPLWSEPISKSAARVETLRSYGYKEQALCLTVATVRRLKLHQEQWCMAVRQDSKFPSSFVGHETYDEGWIGHPFDPINVMVDMLLNASTTEPSTTSSVTSAAANLGEFNPSRSPYPYNQAFMEITNQLFQSLSYPRVDAYPILPLVNMAPRRPSNPPTQVPADKNLYFHVPVPGCCQKDSYLTLAVELALIALGQQRSISTIATAQERAVRQESELISKLETVDTSDPLLIEILKNQTSLLLDGGPFQNSCGITSDPAPLHTFARYLFDSLVPHHSQLAYKVGVYALKMPLAADETTENLGPTRASPQTHLRNEQLALAQTMFSRAKEEKQYENFLKKVYRASVKNIRNPAYLLKLSKHVLKEANSSIITVQQPIHKALLQTAFDLGLQVLKLTLSHHSSNSKPRREAIQFIIDCSTDMGLDSVLRVMKDAREYFSPIEALNLVLNRDGGDCINLRCKAATKLKLKEGSLEMATLIRSSKDLVLDCAALEPSNCALDAIKYCENDEEFMKMGLKIVIDAGLNRKINSSQLIEVADYVNNLGMVDKAFEIALVAVDIVSIPVNSDNATSRKSIISACQYAANVKYGFTKLIPKLTNNIHCATLLSDIYQNFGPGSKSMESYQGLLPKVPLPPELPYSNFNRDQFNAITKDFYNLMNTEYECWRHLLNRTIEAFVTITRNRLQNISPRHYGEFIDFLVKAQATFDKAPDGPEQFKSLIAEIIKAYRTKKKLMERLKERFDISYMAGRV